MGLKYFMIGSWTHLSLNNELFWFVFLNGAFIYVFVFWIFKLLWPWQCLRQITFLRLLELLGGTWWESKTRQKKRQGEDIFNLPVLDTMVGSKYQIIQSRGHHWRRLMYQRHSSLQGPAELIKYFIILAVQLFIGVTVSCWCLPSFLRILSSCEQHRRKPIFDWVVGELGSSLFITLHRPRVFGKETDWVDRNIISFLWNLLSLNFFSLSFKFGSCYSKPDWREFKEPILSQLLLA